MKKYYLYIDESGDHGLVNLDRNFPVFLLCGVLVSDENYNIIRSTINVVKRNFWGSKEVIFHSRNIRKCNKEFQVLFDLDLKSKFYEHVNRIIQDSKYRIIASAISKEKYIKNYGRLSNDVYELALSFIIERAVFCLDEKKDENKQLEIVIEKRGKKEDKKLEEHFQRLMSRGTAYIEAGRLADLKITIHFKDKKENINGLQLADLVAYPIARYVIEPERANPAFEVLKDKIYSKGNKRYGLKIFP
ncbi:DUF3800 domain-containing protein [Chryseobacterium koreense]|uniref:3-deoxy-D-manno-octulosonic acid transferase n=1 Tax=Chryseobacterium koreense CCUG 49689 TaxID=1304281 RepID=A0A0J7IYE1_9FLAO|nr:DUF3800 domain-containing protein [Chryseobacterium koreense]KMQ71017.1 hypothetical protein ACM44_08680 [Chryseobacterium koreense CCUG 49689]MBB5334711.1 hypothetical protein [Chryseobacterium koreense]